MKKAIICLIVILTLSLCLFTGCGRHNNEDPNKIPERPEDTNLEFWIAQDVSEVDFSEYESVNSTIPGYIYLGKDYRLNNNTKDYVLYVVNKYPDNSDGKECVTQIIIDDSNVTIYGINCNSSFKEFDKAMKANGYKVKTSNLQQNQTVHTASFGKVRIALSETAYKERPFQTHYTKMLIIGLQETSNT